MNFTDQTHDISARVGLPSQEPATVTGGGVREGDHDGVVCGRRRNAVHNRVVRAKQRRVPDQTAALGHSGVHRRSAGGRFLHSAGGTRDMQLHLLHVPVEPGHIPQQNERFTQTHEPQVHSQHG